MRRASLLPVVLVLAVTLVFVPATWAASMYKYKVLHTFTGGDDGGLVASGLLLDGSGNLYGTTYWGGTGTGCGGDPGICG